MTSDQEQAEACHHAHATNKLLSARAGGHCVKYLTVHTFGRGSLTMASIRVAAWYLVCKGLYTGSSTIQKGCKARQSALASCCRHVRAASRTAEALPWLLALLPLLLSLSLPVSLSEPDHEPVDASSLQPTTWVSQVHVLCLAPCTY